MADLRIVDAPVLLQESITDDVKMPTGGLGNYAIRLGDLVWYVVTKEQLASKGYVDTSSQNVQNNLDTHIADKANPHQVTKEQVGLGNVDNTADIDKPVSNAVSSAIITATTDMATKAYVDNKDGDLTKLATTDKTNLVKAVNEVYNGTKDVSDLYNRNVVAGAGKNGWTDLLILLANGRTLRDKITEIVSIKDFGAKCDGKTDDTVAIQTALDSMVNFSELNFGYEDILISKPLVIKKSHITLKGDFCNIRAGRNNDIVIFQADNLFNINIEGFTTSNTTTAQTFIKANSTHHLHVSKCNIDGTKLGFDLNDCYWFSTDKIRMQSTYQAFIFRGAVTAFDLRNTSVNGSGIPSFVNNSIGGDISGCSFESGSGRIKFERSFGINISGNYFEGYDANTVDSYLTFGYGTAKVNNGFNISGNLFYAGAKKAMTLLYVDGFNISGNYINTTYGIELYAYDDSKQSNITYHGNSWSGEPSKEFLVSGKQGNASISTEYSVPLIFKQQKIGTRTLDTGEAQIYNKNGALAIKTPTMDSSIATFSDMVAFLQANKIFVNKTYTNMLTSAWRLANATSQADSSLSGALLITLTGGIALTRQTITTVVGNKYYLAARVKINNPMAVRFGYTNGGELANYPEFSEDTTTVGEYKYLTGVFTATSTSTTIGFTADGGKSGDTFSVVDWLLIDLTAKYGAGNELSKDMLDSAIKL